MATLIHLPYSPWSEKARWALDHHALKVKRRLYVPMVGEPWLRVLLRRPRGKVTVPLLIDGIERFEDSTEIAWWADARGKSRPLFPKNEQEAVASLVDRSERILALGRMRATAAVSQSKEALRESVPAPFNAVGPLADATAWLGVRHLRRKYGFSDEAPARIDAELGPMLEEMTQELGGRDYFLGQFSFADIAVAVSLQFICPVAQRYIRLGPTSREAWTSGPLSRRFVDLLRWRDGLYERHR